MKNEKKDTRIHLVAELEKLPKSPKIKELIREAKAGEFHDYKGEKYDCGKVELYRRLNHLGLKALADRVLLGEFDEEPDAHDLAAARKWVPNNLWGMLGL